MFFDPQYEVLIASQKLAASRQEATALRLGRELGKPSRALSAFDNVILFASRGAQRRRAERIANTPPTPCGESPLAA